MANKIDRFTLPRLDWYDNQGIDPETGEIIGRIYKDVLIENFNAIEEKLIEMTKLDAFDVNLPDLSSIVYPDVTLNSEEDSIVNLRSLMNIMNCRKYPITCDFNGTKCTKMVFYTDDNKIIERLDYQETGASDSKPWVYCNLSNGDVTASASSVTPAGSMFVGCYTNGSIKCNESGYLVGRNVLQALSKMKFQNIGNLTVDGNNAGNRKPKNWTDGGDTVGWSDTERHSGSFTFTRCKYGRTIR